MHHQGMTSQFARLFAAIAILSIATLTHAQVTSIGPQADAQFKNSTKDPQELKFIAPQLSHDIRALRTAANDGNNHAKNVLKFVGENGGNNFDWYVKDGWGTTAAEVTKNKAVIARANAALNDRSATVAAMVYAAEDRISNPTKFTFPLVWSKRHKHLDVGATRAHALGTIPTGETRCLAQIVLDAKWKACAISTDLAAGTFTVALSESNQVNTSGIASDNMGASAVAKYKNASGDPQELLTLIQNLSKDIQSLRADKDDAQNHLRATINWVAPNGGNNFDWYVKPGYGTTDVEVTRNKAHVIRVDKALKGRQTLKGTLYEFKQGDSAWKEFLAAPRAQYDFDLVWSKRHTRLDQEVTRLHTLGAIPSGETKSLADLVLADDVTCFYIGADLAAGTLTVSLGKMKLGKQRDFWDVAQFNKFDGAKIIPLAVGTDLYVACQDRTTHKIHVYKYDGSTIVEEDAPQGLGLLGGFAGDSSNLFLLTGKRADNHENIKVDNLKENDRKNKLNVSRPDILKLLKVGDASWSVDLNGSTNHVYTGWQVKKPIVWGGASLAYGEDKVFGVFSREHMTGTSGSSTFAVSTAKASLQKIGRGKDHCFGARAYYDAAEKAFVTLELHDHEATIAMSRWEPSSAKEDRHDDYRIVYYRPNNGNAIYTDICGLAEGSGGYLVVFSSWYHKTSAPHNNRDARENARNLGAVHVPKNFHSRPKNFSGWDTNGDYRYAFDPLIVNTQGGDPNGVKWLTGYTNSSKGVAAGSVERPKVVKVGNSYVALWEEHAYASGKVTYKRTLAAKITLDRDSTTGKVAISMDTAKTEALPASARLPWNSDPVAWNNKVAWVTSGSKRLFIHTFDPALAKNPYQVTPLWIP